MMEVLAKHRYARISPQKARLIADQIRGQSAGLVQKVLESAIANAEHNEGADIDELKVSKAFVDEGPTMKRIQARAKGRANQILKRSSHITVMVSDS